MRLKFFYVISCLCAGIGILDVRTDIEHKRQVRLISEMSHLNTRCLQEIERGFSLLKGYTHNFKKLRAHNESELIKLWSQYQLLLSPEFNFGGRSMIQEVFVDLKIARIPADSNDMYAKLIVGDALLRRITSILDKEYQREKRITPMPILQSAQVQYPIGLPIHGKFVLFNPVYEEKHFSAIVNRKIIVNPTFPLRTKRKSTDIELMHRNPVTQEETVFRVLYE